MKITNIHEHWGSIIEFNNPMDFFNVDADTWRDLIYKRKLLVFKKMEFSRLNYMKFAHYFGAPWKKDDYRYSLELAITETDRNIEFCTTEFSNILNQRIANEEMPWHADRPNRKIKPYPHRSLWMVDNPNSKVSGKTRWLNINLDHCKKFLSEELVDLLPRTEVQQQSWYYPGTDLQRHDLIKVHPITGKESLRLNTVNNPYKKIKGAWITNVYIDGVDQPDCELIEKYKKELLPHDELMYTHTWDLFDIAIYDNYEFIHGRTEIVLETTEVSERKIMRTNIDHMTDSEWSSKKKIITKARSENILG